MVKNIYKIVCVLIIMVFKKGGENTGSKDTESENWNVAKGFVMLKILNPIYLLDKWETIAQFGTEEVDEDMNYNSNQINKRRVEALQRLHFTIKQLLGNVIFAIKIADRPKVKALLDRIQGLDEFLGKTHNASEDLVSHEEIFTINEDLFRKVLNILQEVKDQLNTPLNNAGLIFRPSEDFDMEKIMNDFIQGG